MTSERIQTKVVAMPDPIKTLQAHDDVEGMIIDLKMQETQFGNTASLTILLKDGSKCLLNQRHSGGDSYKSLFDQMTGKTMPLFIKSSISRGFDGRTYEVKVPTPAQLKAFFASASD